MGEVQGREPPYRRRKKKYPDIFYFEGQLRTVHMEKLAKEKKKKQASMQTPEEKQSTLDLKAKARGYFDTSESYDRNLCDNAPYKILSAQLQIEKFCKCEDSTIQIMMNDK